MAALCLMPSHARLSPLRRLLCTKAAAQLRHGSSALTCHQALNLEPRDASTSFATLSRRRSACRPRLPDRALRRMRPDSSPLTAIRIELLRPTQSRAKPGGQGLDNYKAADFPARSDITAVTFNRVSDSTDRSDRTIGCLCLRGLTAKWCSACACLAALVNTRGAQRTRLCDPCYQPW